MSDEKDLNILQKIMATIRSEARELTDAVRDSAGTKKIEDAFDSAKYKLKEAKRELTEMMSKERKSSRLLEIIEDEINQKENRISEALSLGDQPKAMKHAVEVVDLELNRVDQMASIVSITTNINYLQRQLELSERELKEFDRQLSMIKTTEKVQQATDTIMNNIDGADAHLISAKKTLDRIRSKQKNTENRHIIEAQMLKDYSEKSTRKTEIKSDKVIEKSAQDVIKRIQDKS